MRVSILACAAGCSIVAAAEGQVFEWINPAGGLWTATSNWTPSGIPEGADVTAQIGLTGVYTVDLSTAQILRNLRILNPGTRLASTGHLTIGGELYNAGEVTVRQVSPGVNAAIRMSDGSSLRGPGVVRLIFTDSLPPPFIEAAIPGSWTHGPGHTIRGGGSIAGGMINQGLIEAQFPWTLTVSGIVTNTGTIRTGAGRLLIRGTMSQSGDGQLVATGNDLVIDQATVRGGVVGSVPGQRIQVLTRAGFDATRVFGTIDVSQRATVVMTNSVTLDAEVRVNTEDGQFASEMVVQSGAVIGGTGEIVLQASPSQLSYANVRAESTTGSTWTLGSQCTIRGMGRVTYGFVNDGTVSATMPGSALEIVNATVVNNGTLNAWRGTLRTMATTVRQSAAGSMRAIGTDVELTGTTVIGGSLSGSLGGRIIVAASSTFDAVRSDATIHIVSSGLVLVRNSITNDGTIAVNADGVGVQSRLRLLAGSELRGRGTVDLRAAAAPLDRATLDFFVPGANGADHTIGGSGRVRGTWTNRGIVAPGGMLREIEAREGAFTQAAEGTLRVELEASERGGPTRLTGDSTKILGGTLELTLAPGFVPSCEPQVIISGPVQGRFARVVGPRMDRGRLAVEYGTNSVTVRRVLADQNEDGFVDFFDYDAFVACFEDGSCATADFNNDGFVDFFDYVDFVAAFEAGC